MSQESVNSADQIETDIDENICDYHFGHDPAALVHNHNGLTSEVAHEAVINMAHVSRKMVMFFGH